ncbi:MAG: AAA family ATPase [bacterium]
MIGDKRFIEKIKINNISSFGPDSEEIELKSLNVLVGPNASGKSNFIEVIKMLKAMPTDIRSFVNTSGGPSELLWKGGEGNTTGIISTQIYYPLTHPQTSAVHNFTFGRKFLFSFYVTSENIILSNNDIIYTNADGKGKFTTEEAPFDISKIRKEDAEASVAKFRDEEIDHFQSILSQRKGPDYFGLTFIALNYSRIKVFSQFDINSSLRNPQRTDMPDDFLEENASNLNMIINDLDHNYPKVINDIEKILGDLTNNFSKMNIKLHAGMAQLFFKEIINNKEVVIHANRLSDGTLKFLCLLIVLFHPKPPPLICIEEPEAGLHPDMIPIIADLLVDASHRTQLIVTTHSDILIDALTKTPEAVIVCEKHEGSTTMRRLDEKKLKAWLKKYSLGELWRKGEIGGNRW